MKSVRYFIEGLLLAVLFWFFSLFSAQKASAIGGWIGRTIGSRLAASRKAKRNLERAMPHLLEAETNIIIRDMWDNLGRVMAEYPHLKTIARDRTEVVNRDILERIIGEGQGAVFIGAHLGNWEMYGTTMFVQFEQDIILTYRAPNNPWSDKLLYKARTLNNAFNALPKSRSGGRDLMKAMKDKSFVGILIDQKYNEGVSVPFFGHEAMTNPVFVQLCQKFNVPLIPVQCIRTGDASFRMKVYEPLKLYDEKGKKLTVEQVIVEAHTLLEQWIKENPGQWLWLHRRWRF